MSDGDAEVAQPLGAEEIARAEDHLRPIEVGQCGERRAGEDVPAVARLVAENAVCSGYSVDFPLVGNSQFAAIKKIPITLAVVEVMNVINTLSESLKT